MMCKKPIPQVKSRTIEERFIICGCGSALFNVLGNFRIRCFKCGNTIKTVDNEKLYPELIESQLSSKH